MIVEKKNICKEPDESLPHEAINSIINVDQTISLSNEIFFNKNLLPPNRP